MKKFALLLALPLIAVACGGSSSDTGSGETAVTLDPAAVSAGEALFVSNNCVTCHGSTGEGDGAAAAAFPVKPRKYSDAAWQDSVTDDAIKAVILEGGGAHGLSQLMPAHAQFAGKDADLSNIVTYIRSLKK